MRQEELVSLFQKYENCIESEAIFKAYLSDLFPTERKMSHVLVNLYHLGIIKEIDAGAELTVFFSNRFKKLLIETYGTDSNLAEEAVQLWMLSYGKGILGREVTIPPKTQNDEGGPHTEIQYGMKMKDFSQCSFKITIPKISLSSTLLRILLTLIPGPKGKEDLVLSGIYLSDKLHNHYEVPFNDKRKLKKEIQKKMELEVPIKANHFLLGDCHIVFYILSENDVKYEIAYQNRKDKGMVIEYVMCKKMSEDEKKFFEIALEPIPVPPDVPPEEPLLDPISIPTVTNYKNALLSEMHFIKSQGGRRYKLSNGVRINTINGISTYSFEIESELTLSDDAPVTLYVGNEKVNGSVLSCEGFQILITINRDFGKTISTSYLGVEPWKLLEALSDRLNQISDHNYLMMKLISDGPSFPNDNDLTKITKGQTNALKTVEQNPITVIWGPPGTGKTYTMACIADKYLSQGKTILVVSHSNVSVDGVVKQTVSCMNSVCKKNLLENGKVLRYGFVRDPKLMEDDYAVSYNYVLNTHPELKTKIEQLKKEKEQLKHSEGYLSSKGEAVEKELKKLRVLVREYEKDYVSKASFVATTISKVTVDPVFEGKQYDIVMFDEVSMAYVPQVFCAASFAAEKLVLVGDFKQLPPIVQSPSAKILQDDIFAFLGISKRSDVYSHPWLVMLNEQRRMHPDISGFPNRYIYNRLLIDHGSMSDCYTEILRRQPVSGHAISMVSLAGMYCAAMKNSDHSRFNVLSAVMSFLSGIKAEQSGEESVGIITPYAAHTRLIRAMLQDHQKKASTAITCSTVHQFQGSERDVIFFDAVESYPSSKVGYLMGKDLTSVARLINVAVTRAKGKFVLIANHRFWGMKYKNTSHTLWKLIDYISKSGNTVSNKTKTMGPYLEALPNTDNICRYTEIQEAINSFKRDLYRAKEKVVISIPDGVLDPEFEEAFFKLLCGAKESGIQVLCKTKGYSDLPTRWKSIAWTSDNSIFPLIAIDDKVMWYGLPKSRGQFQDGNAGFITVCHTYFRIKGEHTLELIKSFSDLEYRTSEGSRVQLTEKKQTIEIDGPGGGSSAVGLDAFIQRTQKCPKCKNPMRLTKGKSGKVFLKCSSPKCSNIEYLTPELTNHYITAEHVSCPIHHCDIYAALGKYGIYVKCSYGHFIKPEQI